MIVGVVGVGVVGGAVKYGMEKLGHEVRVHDIALDTRLGDVMDAEVCFICVPTNQKEDGSCDISIVDEIINSLTLWEYRGIIVIKSTVTPGTTEKLYEKYHDRYSNRHGEAPSSEMRIAFVPEFLRERCAVSDFTESHDVCVIGVKDSYGPYNTYGRDYSDVVYETIVEAHGKYPQKFVRMNLTEAELSKYFSNVYNALRVTFANGFYELCEKLGADYSAIKNAIVERPTLVDMYLDCNDNFRGFGGVCLPKDTSALAKLAKDLGIEAQIFQTIVDDNKLYNTTVFDKMRP